MPWYCLRTQAHREGLAAADLRERGGYEVVAPRLRVIRRTPKGKSKVIQYLFPRYLFARERDSDDFRNLRYARGVAGMVHRGEAPALVPDAIIADLRATYPDEELLETPDPARVPGTEVVIVSGSLKTLRARVLAYLPAEQRVRLLIDFLGRETSIDLPEEEALAIPELLPT